MASLFLAGAVHRYLFDRDIAPASRQSPRDHRHAYHHHQRQQQAAAVLQLVVAVGVVVVVDVVVDAAQVLQLGGLPGLQSARSL